MRINDRQTRKIVRANILRSNPALLAAEVSELRDLMENRLVLAKGDRGEIGAVGPRGLIGPKGDSIRGEKGETGTSGKDGRDGYTPRKNVDYFDGRDGRDASFDPQPLFLKLDALQKELKEALTRDITVEQVIEAIRGLRGDDRIDAKSIKNIPSSPVYQQKKKLDMSDLRWHGGGLSTSGIYTETPAGLINSINKTYTVLHPIHTVFSAAINGTYLFLNSDYTFSGSTITFITALDSSLSGLPFAFTYA